MAGIGTSIQVTDRLSPAFGVMTQSINMCLGAFADMQTATGQAVDTTAIRNAQVALHELNQAAAIFDETMQGMSTPQIPVPQPAQWQSDNLPVFTGTGVERFQQEAQSANAMMQQLNDAQNNIARQAYNTNLLPPEAFQDMNSLAVRVDNLRNSIQMITDNPVNMGTEQASAGLEQLRAQLSNAIQQQNNLNAAMASGDIDAVNSAYLQLSQTVSSTERYIRDNTNEQGRFNQQIRDGTSNANSLMNSIKGMVAAYISVQGLKNTLNMSDELTQTTARLEMMGQAFGDAGMSGQELMNSVYASAQDARGSLTDMASVVARFGNNARDAFGSAAEVVDFANLVQKQMAIAGASTQEAANAELQLSQALGSGVLRGDELNSIFEQAPNLIQNIADYLDVPIGQIRDMAADGELSAGIVRDAIFSASDEINTKFAAMPMTWGQLWQSFQNTATMAFQPVLQRLNEVANSAGFQTFVNNVITAMAVLSNIVLNVFDLIGTAAGFIADNWSVIGPVIGGVVTALAIYVGYLAIVKAVEMISTAIKIAMCIASFAHAAAMGAEASETAILTAQQYGFNTALLSCPLTWMILLFIAIIAVIIIFANKIAETSEVANSGFSVITGCVFVAGAAFKNLGLLIANIAIGIGAAIGALADNIQAAFHNALSAVSSWWYGLLSDAMFVIENICAALNQLPFVEFDYSGITAAANDYAAKSAAAAADKWDYASVGDAFDNGASTFDAFKDGWASDAYNAGANWGNNAADKLSQMLNKLKPSENGYQPSGNYGTSGAAAGTDAGGDAAKTAANTGQTAANTAAIASSLDISNEQLKYLRDIAERDTVNRFTTASIKVEMTNHNNINSNMDLDGIVNDLTGMIDDAVNQTAAGVHK